MSLLDLCRLILVYLVNEFGIFFWLISRIFLLLFIDSFDDFILGFFFRIADLMIVPGLSNHLLQLLARFQQASERIGVALMHLPFMSSEVIISDLRLFWNQLGDLWKDGLKRLDCGLWKLGIDWQLEGDVVNNGLLEQHLLML